MDHNPERWTILGHLLTFDNVGPKKIKNASRRFEKSERGLEGKRIEAYRHLITAKLIETTLKGKQTYDEIVVTLNASLDRLKVPDDKWIRLDLLAEALERKRANVLAVMEKEGRFWNGRTFRFTSFVHVFTFRLWPEDNPPWVYPEPGLLWADKMNARRISAHRHRAATEAAKLCVQLLTLPLDKDDDLVTATQNAEEYKSHRDGDPQMWIDYDVHNWPIERMTLRRDSEVLKSFVLACDGAIRMYSQNNNVIPLRASSGESDQAFLHHYGSWSDHEKHWQWHETDITLAYVVKHMAFFQPAMTKLAKTTGRYFLKKSKASQRWEPVKSDTMRSRFQDLKSGAPGDEETLARVAALLDEEFERVHGRVQM